MRRRYPPLSIALLSASCLALLCSGQHVSTHDAASAGWPCGAEPLAHVFSGARPWSSSGVHSGRSARFRWLGSVALGPSPPTPDHSDARSPSNLRSELRPVGPKRGAPQLDSANRESVQCWSGTFRTGRSRRDTRHGEIMLREWMKVQATRVMVAGIPSVLLQRRCPSKT
jgi:hypothetical protein